jgi:DNA-binding HxlR family transcriptional regulator
MGKTADYSQQECAVAATLQVVGDPWTLLILSDAFNGVRRFEQWCERLGLARNVLAYRLKTLVNDGLMERRLYCERPERYEYVLTPKGRDTFPILMAMHEWGNRHVYGRGNEPVRYLHRECGHAFQAALHCAVCGEPAGHHNLHAEQNQRTADFVAMLERKRG